jgi:ribosomal-protein-alanine N-acetyltransferase
MPTDPKTLQTIFSGAFPLFDIGQDYCLRIIKRSDAKHYMEYIQHKKVAKYIPDGCIPQNITQAETMLQDMRDYFNKRQSIYWAIAKKADDQLIGTCGIEAWSVFHNRIEVSYDLAPDYWRQGIMQQAMSTIMEYAYTKLEVNRIEAFTMTNNDASAKLLESLEFSREATLKQYRFYKGKFIDIDLFAHTRSQRPNEDGLLGKLKNMIKK